MMHCKGCHSDHKNTEVSRGWRGKACVGGSVDGQSEGDKGPVATIVEVKCVCR